MSEDYGWLYDDEEGYEESKVVDNGVYSAGRRGSKVYLPAQADGCAPLLIALFVPLALLLSLLIA